jgi:hypothetical protein
VQNLFLGQFLEDEEAYDPTKSNIKFR